MKNKCCFKKENNFLEIGDIFFRQNKNWFNEDKTYLQRTKFVLLQHFSELIIWILKFFVLGVCKEKRFML